MELGKVIKTVLNKQGKRLILRYPKVDDVNELLRYVNALIQEDTFVLISGKPQTIEEEKIFFDHLLTDIQRSDALSLVIELNGKIVGMTGVTREKFRMHHVGMLGISLAPEIRDQGVGSMAFSTLIEECKKMGFKLLTLHCFENNARAFHMYKKLGFIEVGIIPKAVLYRGAYVGQIIMYLPLV